MLHGKNLPPFTGAVFVNSLQVLDSLQENPFTYGESVSATFNLRYPGQYFDKESGLSYNYFRSYDSKSGRYTQADPIGLRGGWNKFAYVSGNPLSYTDPLGLWTFQLGFSVTGSWMPTVFGIGPSGQLGVGIVFDGNGNAGGYWTGAFGAALGSSDVVGGVQGVWSNGDTICDLEGVSSNAGLNAGFGFGGTVDTFGGSGTRGQAVGGVGVTLGGGAGVAGFAGKSYTSVTKFGSNKTCTCK
jgi:RHS repeat-associated protein